MTTHPRVLRTRPLTVEAFQLTADNLNLVAAWSGGEVIPEFGVGLYTDTKDFTHAEIGEWIIKGPFGEFYPVPDRVVSTKYEAVVSVVSE